MSATRSQALSGPSLHLSWRELACKDGTPYPAEWRETRAKVLAEEFEMIRIACGDRPITVLSAYRTKAHNTRVGGAPKSQHLHGRALDLRPPAGVSLDAFYRWVLVIAQQPTSKIRGIGKYLRFVHVDIRSSTSLVCWNGLGA